MAHTPKIDFLSFTFPVPTDLTPHRILSRAAQTVCGFGMYMHVGDVEERGRHGYTFSSPVIDQQTGEPVGFIAAGGRNHGSCLVSITGAGCHLFDPERVALFLDRVGGRITRIDIAVDDYEGKRTPHTVREAYLAGQFRLRGQNPIPGQAGPWDNPDKWGEGLTYYVGKRGNGKMLRCYHKGREQGDPTSNWVRFEVELRRNYRDVSTEVLRDPLAAFVSAYPWLQWAAEEAELQSIGFLRREKTRANLRHLLHHASRSYGKLLDMMDKKIGVPVDQLFEALKRPGKPSRVDDRYYWKEGELIDGVGVCSYV